MIKSSYEHIFDNISLSHHKQQLQVNLLLYKVLVNRYKLYLNFYQLCLSMQTLHTDMAHTKYA